MGRKALPEQRILVSSRITPTLRDALEAVAQEDRRSVSTTIDILLLESPRVAAKLKEIASKNGRGKNPG